MTVETLTRTARRRSPAKPAAATVEQAIDAAVAKGAQPPAPEGKFKIYVAYGWSSDSGKKHGFGGMVLNSTFPEIETEAQIHQAFVAVANEAKKPNVVIINVMPLEG